MKQTRRQLLGSMIAGGAIAAGMMHTANAMPSAQLPSAGEKPAGTMKAGPLGLTVTSGFQQTGQIPVAMICPAADVDAEVERTKIVDGQMLDPSGPWIIAWYEGTGLAGEVGPKSYNNCLVSGHVDYWDVGPAVLRNIANIPEGTPITLDGQDGGEYVYKVESIERIDLRNLPEGKIQEITGRTDYGALTIVTCGGEFDYNAGEYLQRDIVRCRLVTDDDDESGEETSESTDEQPTPTGELGEGAQATVTDGPVNVRAEPSTGADIAGTVAPGTTVTITGASQDADGYTWWPIQTDDGTSGWMVSDFLAPAE
ncbi:MAG TPA: SH3 domain-containing protein [Thermomicrobiales bacterium]|nr:SH3 domain-containing protein [Thermomicrobiales bacterium]